MRLITRAVVAGSIAVTGTLLVAPTAHALDDACHNQSGDVSVLDIVGVDEYDDPASGNGILAVCTQDPWGADSHSGVRVDQTPSGTCVAVIVFSQQFGCQYTIPV